MDYTLIIITSSVSLVSVLIGFLINWLLMNFNYKMEFYKKLIDKRLEAYEKENEIECILSTVMIVDNKKFPEIFESWNSFYTFYMKFKSVAQKSAWYSNELTQHLHYFSAYMCDVIMPNFEKIDSREYGNKQMETISKFFMEMRSISEKDLMNLHKIKRIKKDFYGSKEIMDLIEKEQ